VIWNALESGAFQVFSSDHAPFRFAGNDGKLATGETPSFDQIANGIPGVETRLALLFSHGVNTGRMDINQFVGLTSTNVAKMYGLYPRKGSIAVGADADLVIWDTDTVRSISNDQLHHNVDYTPYEGIKVNAWPATTMSRGRIVWQDGRYLGTPGMGQFLPCDRPTPAKPKVTTPDPL
jgi:dihydropyrimidinase